MFSTVARLAEPAGALCDLARERSAVLVRAIRPLGLEGPVLRLWGGCRDPAVLMRGLDPGSAAVALHLLSLTQSIYPFDAAVSSGGSGGSPHAQLQLRALPESRGPSTSDSAPQLVRYAAGELAAPPLANGRWPFALHQWPDKPKLGGIEDGPTQGTFGTEPRFGQGGIYTDEVKARVPLEAKRIITMFVSTLRGKTAGGGAERLGRTVFSGDPTGVFRAIDADGSGSLDVNEFAAALRRLGMHLLPQHAAELMNALDTDGSGTIELDEFLAVFNLAEQAEAEEKEKQVGIGVTGVAGRDGARAGRVRGGVTGEAFAAANNMELNAGNASFMVSTLWTVSNAWQPQSYWYWYLGT